MTKILILFQYHGNNFTNIVIFFFKKNLSGAIKILLKEIFIWASWLTEHKNNCSTNKISLGRGYPFI